MSRSRARQAFHIPRQGSNQHAPRVDSKLELALEMHRKGWFAEAEAAYREILKKQPRHFDALQLLGAMELQRGRFEEACRLIGAAVKINPLSHTALSNLGYALLELGRPEDSLASCDRALAVKPDFPDALGNRGNALKGLNRYDEAMASYDRALALKPDYADALYNRATVLQIIKRPKDAIASVDRALAIKADYAEAWATRGNALRDLEQYDEACASFDKALAIKPDDADARCGRGIALTELKRGDEALESLDRALAIRPDFAEAHFARGNSLQALLRIDEALASYDKALEIRPDYADALANRASLLLNMQRYDDALASCDRALAIKPDHTIAHSNKLFILDFIPGFGFAEHQAARRRWCEALTKELPEGARRYRNDVDPGRRLVVGYVSADFRLHSAAACFGPILKRHDRANFEVVCYSGVKVEDDTTREFRRLADRWRQTTMMSDEALAEQIRIDGIDILVDLAGHTAGNRLLVFARKPAPVQVTGLGYGVGTGLPAIDYLFSDPVAIPHEARPLFAETVYDLPCLGGFEAPAYVPAVGELPAWSHGHVTFGCLNRLNKVSPAALDLWARIVLAVPGSRLMLKDKLLEDPGVRARTVQALAERGVGAERLELRGGTSHADHLAAYNEIDIALDPFPHNGGMSTWESLWMGVPVVAKLGNSLPSRVSGALLCAIGLNEWATEDDEAYVALAVRQAGNLLALSRLRRDNRARILASAAGNPELYARAVEAAYRKMWQRYAETMPAPTALEGAHPS